MNKLAKSNHLNHPNMFTIITIASLQVVSGLQYYTTSGKTSYAYSPLASFGTVPSSNGNTYVLSQAAPFDMCTPVADSLLPLIRGRSLLVQRGGCSFVRKACIAQQAGASAIVVYNSFEKDSTSSGEPKQPLNDIQVTSINYPVHMFGISNAVQIPVVMVSSREGIILNQLVMHGGNKVMVNITTESPPAACGAWDRWSDHPLQCNTRRERNKRIPLNEWMLSRNQASYDVVEDVQIARLAFTIGALLSFIYCLLSCSRKTRMDQVAQRMQNEHFRRVSLNHFSYGRPYYIAQLYCCRMPPEIIYIYPPPPPIPVIYYFCHIRFILPSCF
jgi:hypothetical protein